MASQTVSATARLSENEAAVGFTASRQLAESLQAILVELIELHLQGKQAHWNLVGHNFRDLHKQLDHIVDEAREASDTVAERMRSLRAVPDGRSDTVVATTTLPKFPEGELSVAAVVDLITTRLYTATATMRRLHDGIDADDPSTADILHAIIDSLEQQAWMISAENRQV
ncbi:DNA starvation/stationary phase protection protein [Streptomyces sp. SL13]|jgi:starvation-inducible DNA-binding protein|uniref:DNA starvation/stationary phase protection protein n=1 Tax=Streptantibioticus silvisoli TaxID=2705255 RepID=A0AA90H3J7_9ACTN|nr:DNA starvation/stationary phase protection protein [Streptantibioticus silvisoli]MDI5964528.1 DNA starvation/stationary phase protection protein [Streptantibioticus silvisoli]MDI5973458.1 DNA starvation/stationary phase protection protein [Streptantibioticus silvisoli]